MDAATPLLGQMLLEHRLLTHAQVLECLEFQAQAGAAGGRLLPLGRIARERGILSAEALEEMLEEQARLARRAGAAPAAPGRSPDAVLRLRRIGGDAQFTTHLALHPASGAHLSLRILDPAAEPAGSPRLERLAERTAALRRLRHPGLQALVTAERSDAAFSLASEHLEAVSLRRLLESGGPLDWRCCWDLAVQAASALDAAHRARICHGALRPSALLLCRGGRAVLAHPGLVLSERDNVLALLKEGGPVPVYLAPERRRGETPASAADDLHALGALLLHAATGRAPFTAKAPEALALPGRPSGPDELPAELPVAFGRILRRLTSPAPEERHPTAAALLQDLARLQERADPGSLPDLWARRLDRLLECESPGDARVPAPSPAPSRFLRSALLPLFLVLLLAPALTFFYRYAHAHRVLLKRGEHHYARGRRAEAMADFLKARSLRPDLPLLQERILSLALESGDYALAGEQIEILRRLRPEAEKPLRLLRADLRLWDRDPGAALEGYRDFVRAYGPDVEILLRIAQAQAAGGDLPGALAGYAAVHAEHPGEPRALLEMARLSSATGAHDQARRLYARYLELFPESRAALAEQAGALEACRAFGEAAATYARLAALAPGDGEPAFRRARALMWAGEPGAARDALQQLGGAAVHAERGVLLAQAHEALRDFPAAEATWKEIIALHPARPELPHELGRFYERTGRFEAALAQLAATQERFGANAPLTASLGRIQAALKKPEEALASFLRAARLDPADPAHPLAVARTLIWLERPREALEVLAPLAPPGGAAAEVEVERARAYSRLGLRGEAAAILRRLLAGAGDDAPFLRTLAELELEGAAAPGRARLYEAYLRKHPEDLDALRRFAALLRAAGDHARAWPLYRRRLETEARTPALLLEASEEASWAGDAESAIRLLEGVRRSTASSK